MEMIRPPRTGRIGVAGVCALGKQVSVVVDVHDNRISASDCLPLPCGGIPEIPHPINGIEGIAVTGKGRHP